MIVRAAAAGEFLRVNASFRAAVGFGEPELANKPFLEWIHSDDRVAVDAILKAGDGHCRVKHRTQSGEWLPLHLLVTDPGSGPVVLARCIPDIAVDGTDEDGLDEATVGGTLATIARIVEEQNPGYRCSILLVADGRFVRGAGPSLPEDYNAAIDGYAVGPTVGSCGTAIYWNVPVVVTDIQADPLWAPFAELAKRAGVAACWSHPFTSKQGRVLGALALYSPEPRAPTAEQLSRLRAAARMTGLAVERGRAEEALREKRKRELELEQQLRQAAKMEALGVLAGGVAHDFNNVLATILANAELSLELLPADSEVTDMLTSIVEASRRAGEFCQQMLAYAGRGSVRTSRIEVGALLSELSALVQAALSKKASLEYALHSDPVFVEGDENQLLQVVMNLVTNAAEALGDNEGRIEVGSTLAHYDAPALARLDPQADLPAGQYVRLTVRDNGSGMDAATLGRIFDPFFTTKFTGRGLGLSAVKGIITGHNGVIHVDSELGVGTTFTVLLPTQAAPHKAESTAEPVVQQEAARKRILVVDDEAPLRTVLCKRLAHNGFDVIEAADGQQAIDIFRGQPNSIDCVLLDFSMPKLSGKEVHQRMQAIRQDIPVVVMSGFNEGEILGLFNDAKLAGALQKPVAAEQLITTIRHATA